LSAQIQANAKQELLYTWNGRVTLKLFILCFTIISNLHDVIAELWLYFAYFELDFLSFMLDILSYLIAAEHSVLMSRVMAVTFLN
jgi:hypothetical protein